MPTLTINGVPFTDLAAWGAAAGNYYALPPLGMPPCAGKPEVLYHKIRYPGRDNTGRKKSGFLQLPIYADLIVVNTVANAGTARKTMLAALEQLARYTITLPQGDAYPGCVCEGLRGDPHEENVAGGLIGIVYPLLFLQLSDAN